MNNLLLNAVIYMNLINMMLNKKVRCTRVCFVQNTQNSFVLLEVKLVVTLEES